MRDGNEQLEKGDAKAALESYNRASHELPEAPGVQLNRGLALLKQGEFPKAREALLSATQPSAPVDVRADAYENMSLAFYREADALAGQNKHADAQKMFRESLDAAKRSLRLRPGDPNTAWNMELASRRIREEDEKQKQEDEKEKEKQKDKQDNKDDKGQKQNDPNQDKKDDQKEDQKDDPNKDDPKGDQGEQKDKPKPEERQGQAGQRQAGPGEVASPKTRSPSLSRQPAAGRTDKRNPPRRRCLAEAEQALDALSRSQRGKTPRNATARRQRAARERRAPEKDW